MKPLSIPVIALALMMGGTASADEVLRETRDNRVGSVFGGLGGLLVGGAAGGPVGALAGAGLGWLAGGGAQEQAGLSQRAYAVRTASGEEIQVRSPNSHFQPGQVVRHEAGRLHPVH